MTTWHRGPGDPEPADGSVIVDAFGGRWGREGDEDGGIHWHRDGFDLEPASWPTVARLFGPVVVLYLSPFQDWPEVTYYQHGLIEVRDVDEREQP